MAELDLAKLRAAAAEFGYWPATTDDKHLAKLRDDNDGYDGVSWIGRHRFRGHDPHPAPTAEDPERWDCDCGEVRHGHARGQISRRYAHLRAQGDRRTPDD
ncbi:hypothetical protein [[Mycobacterium] crassicus]|uniref:Uncharacterized protein n=1 Tax=[Mycobacterium] crassicus TaxID=2872309 RepID=A0ABU5XGQ1_9MYCO|nr:hypothetical protein [Mycolicibacter sp. MYC098]MEB3021472.1 hypothetical protein [Mycolicibacter sp. MYC098]